MSLRPVDKKEPPSTLWRRLREALWTWLWGSAIIFAVSAVVVFYEPVQSIVPIWLSIACGFTMLFFPLVLLWFLFELVTDAVAPLPPGPTADASCTAERALREQIERELKEPRQ